MRGDPRRALARLGVVFQSRALDGTLSIAQNMAYAGALYGLTRATSLDRGTRLLARLGLEDRLDDKVQKLSGGQQRRVEIARALLHQPRLLLCDEATVGLDIRSRAEIVEHVHALAADEDVGILWATHLIDEIRPDDRVVVLHEGQVLASGSVSDVSDGLTLADRFLALTNRAAA